MCGGLSLYGVVFFFQAEDGIRDLVRSRGLGDVYKRQALFLPVSILLFQAPLAELLNTGFGPGYDAAAQPLRLMSIALILASLMVWAGFVFCLLYTSDAADERSSVDLGGRRIIKKKNHKKKKQRTKKKQNNNTTKSR